MSQYPTGKSSHFFNKGEIKMEKLPNNLIALIYSPQHCSYPEVINDFVPGLSIDTEKKTWSYQIPGSQHNAQNPKKFGEHDYFAKENDSGVIGVYDRTNEKHLTSMVRDWHSTQENKHRNWNFVD
jgi:hypothetical protein